LDELAETEAKTYALDDLLGWRRKQKAQAVA